MVEMLTRWDNSPAVGLAYNVYLLFVPLAMALALGYTILEIIESMTRNGGKDATAEMIVFPLIKFAAVILLLRYGTNIVSAVMGGSNALLDQFAAIPQGMNIIDQNRTLEENFVGVLYQLITSVVPALICFLIQIVCGIIIGCQVITIKIEILLQFGIMPLAISNILQGGIHSAGLRYVKHFIANLFIMMAILMSIRITGLVANTFWTSAEGFGETVLTSLGAYFYSNLLAPVACVGVINTVKSTLREAFS